MRIRHLGLLILITALYGLCAYGVLYLLPKSHLDDSLLNSVNDPTERAKLTIEAQNSIRDGAVTLLTGSALGIAGLVAFLSYGSARRDAERSNRMSQDELFSKALTMVGHPERPARIGAISIIGSVAEDRQDLRPCASATLFALIRERIQISEPLTCDVDGRSVLRLADRDPVSSAALRVLGNLPLPNRSPTLGAGAVVDRRLDICDLRRWEIAGGRFEMIVFSSSYLWDSSFIDCIFFKCVFHQVDWTGVRLRNVKFIESDLNYTNLAIAQGIGVEARGCMGLTAAKIPDWLQVSY
jgi:hypothetical protein